jgi:alpha-galactosidase
MRLISAALLLLCITSVSTCTLAQTTAATPPMGWNSWNHFAAKVDDKTIRATADIMVSSGMRDAGYVYVNIDDTWEGKRDASGVIQTNEKFPDMKALADYVHSKGLKLGIYSSPGAKTCAGYEGSLGHEEQDAATYAAWGIDYLKYDLCGYTEVMTAKLGMHPNKVADPAASIEMMEQVYEKMHQALLKTNRPIVFSLCQYGWGAVWRWGAGVGGNAWRTTGDIQDKYDSMTRIGFGQAGLSRFAGPGHWNDPDMLEVGNGGMTGEEYRTHMSLWSLLAAPLLAGNDLEKMTDETKSILMNREVIALDQDPAGKQADRVYAEGYLEVWAKPLADGGRAVGIFNRNSAPLSLDLDRKTFGTNATKMRDLWKHADVPLSGAKYHAVIPAHGVLLFRVK